MRVELERSKTDVAFMSRFREKLKQWLPKPVRAAAKACLPACWVPKPDKHGAELCFWEGWVNQQGLNPETDYYRKFMMSMGAIENQSFFDDRVCLDIGCGPKGSLTWLTNARAALGLDPLADAYTRFGIDGHRMTYLWGPAEHIPLPSGYVDVVFSMNSLDHVDDLSAACKEIRRVLKPGGHFIGSLNLNELTTPTEPWTLTEALLDKLLFQGWELQYYQVRPRIDSPEQFGPYRYFFEECPEELMKRPGPQALWCRFRAPASA